MKKREGSKPTGFWTRMVSKIGYAGIRMLQMPLFLAKIVGIVTNWIADVFEPRNWRDDGQD